MCTVSTAVRAIYKNCSRLCGMILIVITILVPIARISVKLNIRVFFLISRFIFVYCDADKDTGQRTSNSNRRVSIPYLQKAAKQCFFVASFSSFNFISALCLFVHVPVQIRLLFISLTCMKIVDVDLFSCREVSPLFVFRGSRLPKCPLITTLL